MSSNDSKTISDSKRFDRLLETLEARSAQSIGLDELRDVVLFDEQEVASLFGLKRDTLRNWRRQGRGPDYTKLGDGTGAPVRYTLSSLESYVEKHKNTS
ncbi:MAG: helix-turn-helix transcriptional regulator [Bradymonadaceae bacterium]